MKGSHPAYEASIETARQQLERAHELLVEEIGSYPTPISGCDQQFIGLISDRTRIAACLRALDEQPFVATPRMLDPKAA